MSPRDEASRFDRDAVALERITWLRAVLGALRSRVDASRSMATWRARVPRPFELEALLAAVDPVAPAFRVADVAGALGVSAARARGLLGRAERVGALKATPAGWALTPRGRVLRGELEVAQAAALRDVALGTDPAAWADLWRAVEASEAPARGSAPSDRRSRVQSGAPSD